MAQKAKSSNAALFLLDPLSSTRDQSERAYQYHADQRTWAVPLLIGVGLLIVSFIGWLVDPEDFYISYLVGWFYCLTISLGALFFVIVHHITRAHWPVVVRRIPEVLIWSFPLLAVLSIPILIGIHDLYHWSHEEAVAHDPLLAHKQPYLNVPFFLIRVALYFIFWIYLSYRLYRLSIDQDVNPDPDIPAKQRKVSAWGIPVFAVTVAFASYDLIMSLDPHWYSTIFGVYIFAGAYWSAIAFILFTVIYIQRGGALTRVVRMDHYHDLGKWLFAFTVFWAYIAYSQYMLIWYGNIPEETIWFRHRLEHGWGYHSAALLIAHFIIPFIILLPRWVKRTIPILSVMAVWALVMQWFDLHWLAVPSIRGEHSGFHWLDFTCWFGLFGVFVGLFLYRLERHSVVPQNDPMLVKSLRFENV